METGITFTFAAIFLGAAVLSSIALYARQPIIIAYIALGVALGPFGLGVVSDMELVSGAGHVGIILLLFLLGLDMKPIVGQPAQSTLVALIGAVVLLQQVTALVACLGSAGWTPCSSALRWLSRRSLASSSCQPPSYTTVTSANSPPCSCWDLCYDSLMIESAGTEQPGAGALLRPLLTLPCWDW